MWWWVGLGWLGEGLGQQGQRHHLVAQSLPLGPGPHKLVPIQCRFLSTSTSTAAKFFDSFFVVQTCTGATSCGTVVGAIECTPRGHSPCKNTNKLVKYANLSKVGPTGSAAGCCCPTVTAARQPCRRHWCCRRGSSSAAAAGLPLAGGPFLPPHPYACNSCT